MQNNVSGYTLARVIVFGDDVGNQVIWVQILTEAVCILLHANSFGKSINPSLLSPAMGKNLGKVGSLGLIRQQI